MNSNPNWQSIWLLPSDLARDLALRTPFDDAQLIILENVRRGTTIRYVTQKPNTSSSSRIPIQKGALHMYFEPTGIESGGQPERGPKKSINATAKTAPITQTASNRATAKTLAHRPTRFTLHLQQTIILNAPIKSI